MCRAQLGAAALLPLLLLSSRLLLQEAVVCAGRPCLESLVFPLPLLVQCVSVCCGRGLVSHKDDSTLAILVTKMPIISKSSACQFFSNKAFPIWCQHHSPLLHPMPNLCCLTYNGAISVVCLFLFLFVRCCI